MGFQPPVPADRFAANKHVWGMMMGRFWGLIPPALACLGLALPAQAKIEKAPWGETADHQKVDIYTLTNARGMSARITNYGAFLVNLNVPDRTGKMADVVLGYDN